MDDILNINNIYLDYKVKEIRKWAKIKNQYNQVPHSDSGYQWKSDTVTIRHHKRETCTKLERQQIYPSELHLIKANTSDTEASFLNLHLSISNDIVYTIMYTKRDDFDFEIVNFPFEMVIFLNLYPMEFIFLELSDLLEHLAMWQNSTFAINC